MFGSNTLFVFHHPQDAKAFEEAKKPAPTYEAAQKEIAENSGLNKLTGGGKSKGNSITVKRFHTNVSYQ